MNFLTKTCLIEGCHSKVKARDWCGLHLQRWYKYGDPTHTTMGTKGAGHLDEHGYRRLVVNGVKKREHVLLAELALGHPLPPGAEVHHIDENKSNNEPSNLVVCPDRAYHRLLHLRADAFAACGHYHWRKCSICKQWDSPENLKQAKARGMFHQECHNAYYRQRRNACTTS
jgi:hypothetical protein